jgi:hypothetical protein
MPRKRLTKDEWTAREAKRRQRAAERNVQRWQQRQAQRNYLVLHSSRSPQAEASDRSPIEMRGVMAVPDADHDALWIDVRPDKRSGRCAPIAMSLTVTPEVTPEELMRHMVKAVWLFASTNVQSMLQGAPLGEPQRFGSLPASEENDTDGAWEPGSDEAPSPVRPPQVDSVEDLVQTLVNTIGRERAVDILLRALIEGGEPIA